MEFKLKQPTTLAWVETVIADFDHFLLDHANCEKKASGMAMSMIAHYPNYPGLIKAMLNLAIEELNHFRDVMGIIIDKGLQPASDTKDPYIKQLHQAMNKGKEAYFLDRLLIASIVEARGAERFGLIAAALPMGKMKNFYQAITASEKRHYQLFLDLAEEYCDNKLIPDRLNYLLTLEGSIVKTLPLQATLH